jgi:hypothetical protein
MKYTHLRFSLALLVMFAALVISCSKGGSAGAEGPAGATGTANVIYSDWLDVVFTADTVMQGSVITDTLGYYATINAPKLDANILSKGEFKVYFNVNTAAAPIIYPLPYIDVYSGLNIDVLFHLQSIELYTNSSQISTFTPSGTAVKVFQFRYVLIPGGVSANASINLNNYQETKTALGLKD